MSLIDISGLESGYGKLKILNKIDLRIEPGELIAIFGPNGSGKSTLARSLGALALLSTLGLAVPARAAAAGAALGR